VLAANHINEACKELDKCCVRPQFGKISEDRVGAEIEMLMSKRQEQRTAAWRKLRRPNPEDKHVYDAWYFDLHKAFESHPGLYADVSKLCFLLGYDSSCLKADHGVYLKSWSLNHRYCLQNLLKCYQSHEFSNQRVKSFDRNEIYEIAALIHPRGPLANYATSQLKTACRSLASTYFDSEWLFPNVWDWPSMLIWKANEILETYSLSGNFYSDGMNVHKIAYLDNFLNKVPLDITGVFGTAIATDAVIDWDTLVGEYPEETRSKMFRLAFQSVRELPELTYTSRHMRALLDALHDQEVLLPRFQDVVKIIMAAGEMKYDPEDGEQVLDVEHISVRTFTKLYKVLVVDTGRNTGQEDDGEEDDDDVRMDDIYDDWDDFSEDDE
jgi:hypothetical protein